MDVYTAANAHVYLQKAAQHNPIQYSLAGRLQYAQSGWLTLTVPAALVRGAFDALHEQGAEPPQFLTIPVMSPAELSKIGGPDKVTERGHSFQYTLGPIRSNDPGKDGLSKTWYIQIFSPELKKLRHSYGLEPYIKGTHCFQLPIAVRKTGVLKSDDSVVKASEYLKEPDWRDYDPEIIEKVAASNPTDPRRAEKALKLLNSTTQLYHGSNIGDINTLDPRESHVLNNEKAVFATPDRGLAISNIPRWGDTDFEQGRINDEPWYMREQYPGAIDKILKGSSGYLYHLPNRGFAWDPRLMREEAISKEPVTPTNVEHIPDVYQALKDLGWQFKKHSADNGNNLNAQTYIFQGDVQGVGLRKVLHQILDQRKAEGLAYNDARNNQTLVTLGGNPVVRDRVLRELHNYLDSRDAQYSFQPTQGPPPIMHPVSIGPNEIRNFVERQGFRTPPPGDPYWRSWIRDRYRLKPSNEHLTGHVPEVVAKQLQGEEPVYAKQIEFHPHRWLKAAQHLYHKVVQEAAKDVHPKPTDAQREAGNYRMGHIHVHGLPVTIEVAKGQTRTKVNKYGKKWSRKMLNHYGYIKRTESAADGDHIDVYVGDHPESQLVFIVNQVKPDGRFDEHKVLIGWVNKEEAKKSYLAHYPANWTGLGSIVPTTMDRFKEWIRSGDTSKEFTK